MTVGYAQQILAIDYHLSYYRVASRQLTEGIADPKEFARVEAIKDAALCAIALESGIIQEIGSGKLERPIWEKAIAFIKRYEISINEPELISEVKTLDGFPCPVSGKPCPTNGALGDIPYWYYPGDCPNYQPCFDQAVQDNPCPCGQVPADHCEDETKCGYDCGDW